MGEVSGHQAMADNGIAEPREGEINYAANSGSHVHNGVSEPYVGMEFDSEDAAKAFYDEYARRMGFSSKAGLQGCSQADGGYREFVCGRDVLKRKPTDGCAAMIRIEQKGPKKWVVAKFVKEHSHSTVSLSKVQNLQQRKHFSSVGRTMPETYHGVGLVPSGVMYISMDGNRISTENVTGIRNVSAAAATETSHPVKSPTLMNYTVRTPMQKRTLGKDAQNLLEYFKKMQVENPGFFYAIQLDENNHMTNVFWADARSRTAYSHFGDTVTLDTTYRVNHYRVPFAPFTGVNHHGQMILFGCALLLDDSEASFTWLFKTFLTAMNDRHPVTITTDQDRAIQTAVSKVFPQARHRISKWDVLREGQQKLAHVCNTHPNFQTELHKCINQTETIEDFDSSWNSIIDKYELGRNDWLQSLYGSRAQWVPAYFRDSFFAAISPNQGFDGSLFFGYVNPHTTLPMFFRLYEQALESWYEKELESDFETICTTPVLKTPSPMEKQAADLYTRKVFLKFQEELVETFAYTANRIEEDGANSIFRVAKFEDDQKAYTVILNHSELRANCSCKMFEYSGILCRHVLTVFTVTNVFTLPPHYILKRWTRNAKISFESDENAGESHGPESLTSRYSNLCREAIRYAEEGAITVETYDAAINALREGGKKIAVVKKSVAKDGPPRQPVSGSGNDDKKTPTKTSDTIFLLWPPQNETVVTYDTTMHALGEGGKKIAVTKKSVAKVAHPGHPVSGTGNDGRRTPSSTSDTTSLLWPQQDETVENYDAAIDALREGGNKTALMKRSVAKVAPPSHPVIGTGNDDRRTPIPSSDTTSLLWTQQDETVETYDAAKNALRESGRKIPVTKRSFAKVASPSHLVSGTGNDDRRTSASTSDTTSLLWPQQDGTVETYDASMSAHRQGGKKLAVMKRSVAKAAPPSHRVSGTGNDYTKTPTSTSDTNSLLWPQQNEAAKMLNLNDAGAPGQSVADLNLPQMAPVSFQRDDGLPENSVVLPCLRSMTWAMENKGSTPGNRVAVINLKLQDFSRNPPAESEVRFQLTKVSLEPMLESMTSISEQLSTPAHKVAVINLKLQETEIICGESEVKFQVSRDTLGAVLRSMAYIREQLSSAADAQAEPLSKRPRK